MHDYIIGSLAKDRRDGYLREVEHAELVAEARRASAGRQATTDVTPPAAAERPEAHSWRTRLAHARGAGLHLPLHHA